MACRSRKHSVCVSKSPKVGDAKVSDNSQTEFHGSCDQFSQDEGQRYFLNDEPDPRNLSALLIRNEKNFGNFFFSSRAQINLSVLAHLHFATRHGEGKTAKHVNISCRMTGEPITVLLLCPCQGIHLIISHLIGTEICEADKLAQRQMSYFLCQMFLRNMFSGIVCLRLGKLWRMWRPMCLDLVFSGKQKRNRVSSAENRISASGRVLCSGNCPCNEFARKHIWSSLVDSLQEHCNFVFDTRFSIRLASEIWILFNRRTRVRGAWEMHSKWHWCLSDVKVWRNLNTSAQTAAFQSLRWVLESATSIKHQLRCWNNWTAGICRENVCVHRMNSMFFTFQILVPTQGPCNSKCLHCVATICFSRAGSEGFLKGKFSRWAVVKGGNGRFSLTGAICVELAVPVSASRCVHCAMTFLTLLKQSVYSWQVSAARKRCQYEAVCVISKTWTENTYVLESDSGDSSVRGNVNPTLQGFRLKGGTLSDVGTESFHKLCHVDWEDFRKKENASRDRTVQFLPMPTQCWIQVKDTETKAMLTLIRFQKSSKIKLKKPLFFGLMVWASNLEKVSW